MVFFGHFRLGSCYQIFSSHPECYSRYSTPKKYWRLLVRMVSFRTSFGNVKQLFTVSFLLRSIRKLGKRRVVHEFKDGSQEKFHFIDFFGLLRFQREKLLAIFFLWEIFFFLFCREWKDHLVVVVEELIHHTRMASSERLLSAKLVVVTENIHLLLFSFW